MAAIVRRGTESTESTKSTGTDTPPNLTPSPNPLPLSTWRGEGGFACVAGDRL